MLFILRKKILWRINMGFNTASGLKATQSSIDLTQANIAASRAAGFSRSGEAFNVIMTGSGTAQSMASGITNVSRGTMYDKGTIVQTNVATDLAIDGEGLFPAFDSSGNVVFVSKGDWRLVNTGDYKNSSNCRLLAWKLEKDGSLPTNANVVSSLVPVNLSDIASEAKASTKIDLGMNLQISQKAIAGAGEVAVLATQGINKNAGINDIIVPDQGAWGAIRVGDTFSLQSSEAKLPTTFTYGGFASTYRPADSSIYGAANENQPFTFSDVHTAAPFSTNNLQNLVAGDGITIKLSSGETFTFTAQKNITDDKSFNNLRTFAEQINKTGLLRANITNGRLYIAATDSNKGITFANTGNGGASNLKESLGLSDVKAAAVGSYRFATLADLRNKVNTIDTLASTNQGIGVDWRVASALNTLTVKSGVVAPVVEVGDLFIGDGTSLGQRSVFIPSHDNNLGIGDFVKIAGTSAMTLPVGVTFDDGEYMVTGANLNGFWVAAQGASAAAPAYYQQMNTTNATVACTWQKVAGQLGGANGTASSIAAGSTINITSGATTTTIRIRSDGLSAAAYGTSLDVNDVVFLGGISEAGITGTVPMGYYVVSAAGASNDITLAALGSGFAGGSGGINAAAGVTAANSLSIQKVGIVGATNAAVNTLDSIPIASVVAANGATTATIQMSIPNSGYSVGDKITLGGLSGTVTLGGPSLNTINLDPAKVYTVSNVNNNIITFDVEATGGGTAGVSRTNVGYNSLGLNGGSFQNLYINNMSKFFSEMSISAGDFLADNSLPITEIKAMSATYNAYNVSKNMTSDRIPGDRKVTKTVNVYDSLGVLHSLNIGFAKLEPNKWAVEVYSEPDVNGQYEMDVAAPGLPIAAGQITFDKNGNIMTVDPSLKQAININWKNKSATSSITIDWGDALSSGVTQLEGPKDDRILKADGYGAGLLTGISVTEEGYVVAKFSNGQTVNVYKIPVATFANLNGLTQLSGSIFTQTSESGTALLKEAGRGNIALITSGALTSSNVSVTDELVASMSSVQQYQAQTNVLGTQQKALDALLRATA